MASIISAGTATNTAVSITGDTTGALALATNNGTTALTIDTAQNVGIGTTSPAARLDVRTTSSTQATFTRTGQSAVCSIFQSTADTYLSATNSGASLILATQDTERMRITSAGYVGIDQTAPTTVFCVGGGMAGGSGNWAHFRNNVGTSANPPASDPYGVYLGCNYSGGNNEGNIAYRGSLTFGAWDGSSYRPHAQFVNAASLGASSGGQLQINRTTNSYQESLSIGTNNTQGIHINETSNSSSINLVYFTRQVSGTQTESGRIYWGGSSIAYLTSSDYRLEKDVSPMTTGLSTVMQLNPVNFVWKHNNKPANGFLAHELQEHCPDAVSGEKDALNEDGSIKVQSVDTSFLVATLTAAIQELKTIVDAQAVEIAALKAKVGA